MNLPGAIQALDNPGGIPRELQERITKFKQAVRYSTWLRISKMMLKGVNYNTLFLRAELIVFASY